MDSRRRREAEGGMVRTRQLTHLHRVMASVALSYQLPVLSRLVSHILPGNIDHWHGHGVKFKKKAGNIFKRFRILDIVFEYLETCELYFLCLNIFHDVRARVTCCPPDRLIWTAHGHSCSGDGQPRRGHWYKDIPARAHSCGCPRVRGYQASSALGNTDGLRMGRKG